MDIRNGNHGVAVVLMLAVFPALCHSDEDQTEFVTAAQGMPVTFKCQANAKPGQSKVEWNFQNISGKFDVIYREHRPEILKGLYFVDAYNSSGWHNLTIKNATLGDAGSYTCVIGNGSPKTQLTVFDRYPSDEFCSVQYLHGGSVLDGNACDIEPNAVTLSCPISHSNNAKSLPYLEWTLDGHIIRSTESVSKDQSSVNISDKDLQTSPSLVVCRVTIGGIVQSQLMWSKRVNLTPFRNNNTLINVNSDQRFVNCSDLNHTACSFAWSDKKNAVIGNDNRLDLQGQPSGNYTCVANCSVRDRYCQYEVMRISYIDRDTQDQSAIQSAETDNTKMSDAAIVSVTSLVIIVLVALSISTVVCLKNRFCRQNRNRHRNEVCLSMEEANATAAEAIGAANSSLLTPPDPDSTRRRLPSTEAD